MVNLLRTMRRRHTRPRRGRWNPAWVDGTALVASPSRTDGRSRMDAGANWGDQRVAPGTAMRSQELKIVAAMAPSPPGWDVSGCTSQGTRPRPTLPGRFAWATPASAPVPRRVRIPHPGRPHGPNDGGGPGRLAVSITAGRWSDAGPAATGVAGGAGRWRWRTAGLSRGRWCPLRRAGDARKSTGRDRRADRRTRRSRHRTRRAPVSHQSSNASTSGCSRRAFRRWSSGVHRAARRSPCSARIHALVPDQDDAALIGHRLGKHGPKGRCL